MAEPKDKQGTDTGGAYPIRITKPIAPHWFIYRGTKAAWHNTVTAMRVKVKNMNLGHFGAKSK